MQLLLMIELALLTLLVIKLGLTNIERELLYRLYRPLRDGTD